MAGHGAEESCAKHGETWRCLRFTSMVKALPSIARTQRLDRNIKSDDSETLQSADTLHNGYAFWFGRPYYEMDDDAGYNGGFDSLVKQRTSTMSYANVGGGWGR
ncbi:uncharacterized protein LOC143213007 isoform X1 [Lasioglossum baleicum]|uniref:uncharacterized protein LOC143213007 isoform X1 n=1 Tax=Lasioglossum baleicum TaxID=434251 RepID=UPI003FCDFD66